MSIPAPFRALARSAYRDLYRTAKETFAGDEHVFQAFRMKIRNDALAARQITDVETYEAQNRLAREMAVFLRKNVIQGVRVASEEATPDQAIYNLRITKHTELGDNDTIKSPPAPDISSRSARKKNGEHHTSVTDVAPHNDSFSSFSPSHISMNYSKLKKAHKERTVPELKEEDLEESFVRGSGPGGQSINKTENNVQLLHKPTGIRVDCQVTRSLNTNRRLARRMLIEKLDKIANPGLSKEDFARAKQRERERRRRKKAKKKAQEREVEEGTQQLVEEETNEEIVPSSMNP